MKFQHKIANVKMYPSYDVIIMFVDRGVVQQPDEEERRDLRSPRQSSKREGVETNSASLIQPCFDRISHFLRCLYGREKSNHRFHKGKIV